MYSANVGRVVFQLSQTLLAVYNVQSRMSSKSPSYDVFISHASEDKDAVVRPLANELNKNGLSVWYDEFELGIGDSLSESIDEGLSSAEYGIVILSENFFGKDWTNYELRSLKAQQVDGEKVILPLWYGIGKEDVLEHSPALADLYAAEITQDNIESIADEIHEETRSDVTFKSETWESLDFDEAPPRLHELSTIQDLTIYNGEFDVDLADRIIDRNGVTVGSVLENSVNHRDLDNTSTSRMVDILGIALMNEFRDDLSKAHDGDKKLLRRYIGSKVLIKYTTEGRLDW